MPSQRRKHKSRQDIINEIPDAQIRDMIENQGWGADDFAIHLQCTSDWAYKLLKKRGFNLKTHYKKVKKQKKELERLKTCVITKHPKKVWDEKLKKAKNSKKIAEGGGVA